MALTATDLFNDATTREIGGVGPDQVNLIVSDLVGVQQMLSAADPQINNLTDLHTHVIINQLNEEIASIENANAPTAGTLTLGTDLGQFVGRAINDIHRDIIDIAQGDAGVQALIEGLQTHNAGEVAAAVEQLATNSADVGTNNLMADGGSYADVVAAAQATAVTPTGGNAATDPAAATPAADAATPAAAPAAAA